MSQFHLPTTLYVSKNRVPSEPSSCTVQTLLSWAFSETPKSLPPAVHPHPELEPVAGLVLDLEGERLGQQVEGHLGHLGGVGLAVGDGDAGGNHIGVADRLDLAGGGQIASPSFNTFA